MRADVVRNQDAISCVNKTLQKVLHWRTYGSEIMVMHILRLEQTYSEKLRKITLCSASDLTSGFLWYWSSLRISVHKKMSITRDVKSCGLLMS